MRNTHCCEGQGGNRALPRVVFVQPDGSRETHCVAVGASVMDCAVDNGVPGIRAQCGGGCTCSTCHGIVDAQWFARVGEAVGDERDILAGAVLRPGGRGRGDGRAPLQHQPQSAAHRQTVALRGLATLPRPERERPARPAPRA